MEVCLIWLLLLFASGASHASESESRTILDETFSWLTPDEADRMLTKVKRAGFNVIIPVVWHGRGTSWPSRLAPSEPLWDKKGNKSYHDPLRYLIEKAHTMGMEVHPWFTVSLRQRDFLHEFYDSGTPAKAFNIHLPDFRSYIVSLMLEVVKNYDVDGINMDYIRSMGICESPFCIEDYRNRMHRDLMTDAKEKEGTLAWTSIAKWNADAVEDILERFSREAKALKSHLVISVSSHAGLPLLVNQGTDSIRWANLNWIDVIFHMEYATTDQFRWQLLNKALDDLKDPKKLVLMVGNYEQSSLNKDLVWARNAQTVADLVTLSQEYGQGGNGIALYEYPYLSDRQIEKLRLGPFRESTRASWRKHGETR
jgi:uncharacterized lipoprotein YddW (UPF0748 family)